MFDEKEYGEAEEINAAEKTTLPLWIASIIMTLMLGLKRGFKAMQDEADAKRKEFDESGKFEVPMQYVREQFSNGRTLDLGRRHCLSKSRSSGLTTTTFGHTLDTENVEREEIEDAKVETIGLVVKTEEETYS